MGSKNVKKPFPVRISVFRSWHEEQMVHVRAGDFPILVLPWLLSIWKDAPKVKRAK